MRIEIGAKNYEVSQRLEEIVQKKVGRLEKYLSDDARVKVFCRAERSVLSMEITAHEKSDVFRAEVNGNDMFELLDEVLKKIERQILKRVTRQNHKNKKGLKHERALLYNEELPHDEPARLVRTKSFELKPISVDEAIESFEALDHEFYVFLNQKTKQINVLYRRKDGDYGVIEAMI